MEITLPNSQGNQSFRSVAGKRSNGRAVYLGDPRLALLGRSPVGAEKSTLTTPCPVAAGSVFSGKVQMGSEGEEDEMSGAILEPLLPQSRHSRFFLRFFGEMILRDPVYVERLKRHYAMFKAALPASPSSTEPPMPWSRAKRPKLAQKRKRKWSR